MEETRQVYRCQLRFETILEPTTSPCDWYVSRFISTGETPEVDVPAEIHFLPSTSWSDRTVRHDNLAETHGTGYNWDDADRENDC